MQQTIGVWLAKYRPDLKLIRQRALPQQSLDPFELVPASFPFLLARNAVEPYRVSALDIAQQRCAYARLRR